MQNGEQVDLTSDELRTIGKSMEQRAKIENAAAPWRTATFGLGVVHALAITALKTSQDHGVTFDAYWWGAAAGSFVVYALIVAFIAIAVSFIVEKLSKPVTASRNALITTLPCWWVFMAIVLLGNGTPA